MRLESFKAVAMILGKERTVRFSNGELTIEGLTVDEAISMVGGTVSEPSTVPLNPSLEAQTEAAEDTKAKIRQELADEKAERDAKGEKDPKAKPKKKTARKKKSKGELAKAGVEESSPGNGANGDVSAELRGFKKMRDLLVHLHENGFKEPDAIVAECERIKSQVPILDRVGNLSDRVRRALTVLGLGDDEDGGDEFSA